MDDDDKIQVAGWLRNQLARDSLRIERLATTIETIVRDAEAHGDEIKDLPLLRADLHYLKTTLTNTRRDLEALKRQAERDAHDREMEAERARTRKWYLDWAPALVSSLMAVVTVILVLFGVR